MQLRRRGGMDTFSLALGGAAAAAAGLATWWSP